MSSSQKNNQLAAQGMRDWEGQQTLFKENENKWIKSKSVNSLRYLDFVSRRMTSCYFASYIISKVLSQQLFKIEAIIQRSSVKKVYLKILQNSQENPCASLLFQVARVVNSKLVYTDYFFIIW